MKANRHFSLKNIVAIFMTLCLLLLAGSPPARAGELEDLQAKSERLAKQIAESEKKIKKASKDKGKQEQILKELNKQMDALEEQIRVLEDSLSILGKDISSLNSQIGSYRKKIEDLDQQINDTQETIEEKQSTIASTRQKALERMRASYIAGNPTKLDILLSSKDMTSLFYNVELLKQAAQKDEELIDQLKEESEELRALEASLEEDKAELEEIKKGLESKLGELRGKQTRQQANAKSLEGAKNQAVSKQEQAKDTISQLDKDSAAYKAQLAKLQREREEADRQIDAIIAQQGSSTGSPKDEANEGDFVFPFPYPSCYFSALFGHYPSGGVHNGLDICVSGGTYGKTIVAVQGGKVLIAGWNNSYGYYVNIDHGAGVFTLYAHCSKLDVSVGQSVKKGQKIAEAGSTGNSTGPHLHFEVRLNQNSSVNRVNPLPYFPGKPNKVNVPFSGI